MLGLENTDKYGLPLDTFGQEAPNEFFEIIGRILAVHGKIEYLKERLDQIPADETVGIRKIEQFRARSKASQKDRNTIVHSWWLFGANENDPDEIFGVRYKLRKAISGSIATVSIADVPESEKEQDYTLYNLESLQKVLNQSIITMRIGSQAYTEVMFHWANQQMAQSTIPKDY